MKFEIHRKAWGQNKGKSKDNTQQKFDCCTIHCVLRVVHKRNTPIKKRSTLLERLKTTKSKRLLTTEKTLIHYLRFEYSVQPILNTNSQLI